MLFSNVLVLETSFNVTEQRKKLSKQIRLAPSEIMEARMTWLQKASETKKEQDQGAEDNNFIIIKKL